MRLCLVPAVLVLAAATLAAHADTVYTYHGNDFTTASGPYTTDDSLTLSITLSAPLASTSSLQAYTPTAFSISDGVQTITNLTPGITGSEFVFATSGGVIDQWGIAVFGGNFIIESCGFNPTVCTPQSFDEAESVSGGGVGENIADPGTWTSSAATPEPSTLALFGTGILGLAGVARRKFFNA